MLHSEDYSYPFGDHIGKYELCYRCHIMLHCRFAAWEPWLFYIKAISEGYIFKPAFTYPEICEFLKKPSYEFTTGQGPARGKTFLDMLGDKNIETVVCAAIKKGDKIYTGHRHHNIIHDNIYDDVGIDSIQGFYTSVMRFVDRRIAAELAFKSGQIKEFKAFLFSEDLY